MMCDQIYDKFYQRAEIDEWLAIRREAGQTIDPETAEVKW
jgi:hypothetical protein